MIKRKSFFTILFGLFVNMCMGQFGGAVSSAPINDFITYKLRLINGNDNILKDTKDIRIEYYYDSVGINQGCLSENAYMRFRMLYFYMDDKPGRGEEFREDYEKGKETVAKKFHLSLNDYCEKGNFSFEPASTGSKYVLKVYFIDASGNPEFTTWAARIRLIDTQSEKVLLDYDIHEEQKGEFGVVDFECKVNRFSGNQTKSFIEVASVIGKYFRERFK